MKKIFFGLLILIIGIKARAETLTYENLSGIYYAQNGLPAWYKSNILPMYKIDGKIAYCIEPFVNNLGIIYEANNVDVLNFDKDTLNYIERVGYYGYEYPNHQTKYYYMAAQELIWEKLTGYDVDYYTQQFSYGTRYNIEEEKKEILNLIKEEKDFKIDNIIINVKEEKIIELENDLELINGDSENMYIENQKLYIKPINEIKEEVIVLKNKAYDNEQSFVYKSNGNQTLMKTRLSNPKIYELKINVVGGKIIFNKTDYLNKPLENVKIAFYKENGELYYEGNTDINGQIILDNVPYGNYYLKETKALDGYLLNDETINFTLSRQEDVYLTMKNYEEVKVPSTGIYPLFYRKNRHIIQDYEALLVISKINLINRLYMINDNRNNVDKNVYVLPNSTMPDIINGNLMLAAHSGLSKIAYFKHLDKLNNGDIINVIYNHVRYTYQVVNIYKQDKVGKIRIKRNYDKEVITLVTCDKYDDTKQIVFIAERID